MSPSEMARRKAFGSGLLVSVGFRVFAYGIVWFFACLVDWRLPPFFQTVVGVLIVYGAVLAFPLITSFVAGFLGAYYWRRVPPLDSINPIFITDIVLLGSVWLAVGFYRLDIVFIYIFIAAVDTAICVIGNESGSKFWKGELSRQFVGDFSGRDDE